MHQRHANARATNIHAHKLVVPLGCNIILPHGTHHGTSAAPTSILIKLVMITSAISNKPTWDRARSADTVRVGLPSAYSVWALQLYIPLGRWFSVTPASMDLVSIPMALCIHAPTACQCACNKHSRPQTCCTVGLQHNIAARYAPWHIGCSHFNSHQISSDTIGNLYKANMTKQF